MGDPFNGFRIGSEIILECEFGPSSIRKDSSWGEGCPSLIYIYFLISKNNILYIWNRVPVVLYTVKIAIQMVPQSDMHILRENHGMGIDAICIFCPLLIQKTLSNITRPLIKVGCKAFL